MEIFTLGERLIIYRKRKNITKKQFAKFLGISLAELTKYENDQKEPTPELIAKMSEVLDVSVFDLESGFAGKCVKFNE